MYETYFYFVIKHIKLCLMNIDHFQYLCTNVISIVATLFIILIIPIQIVRI